MFLMNCFCDVPLVEFFRFPVFQAGPWGTVLDLDDCAHKGGAAQGAVFIMSDMQHTVLNRPPDTNSLSICKASRREFFSLMSTSHIHLGVDPHRSIKTLLRSFTMHKGSWLVMSCVCDGGYYRPTSQSFPRNHARVKDPSKMTSLWRSTDAIALTQPNSITPKKLWRCQFYPSLAFCPAWHECDIIYITLCGVPRVIHQMMIGNDAEAAL